MIEAFCGAFLSMLARVVTGVRVVWRGSMPDLRPRIYFANHRSHADFVLLWTALPAPLRRLTRPVAGADYWLQSRLRSFMAERVFHAVLIDRRPGAKDVDPIATMAAALDLQQSLIIFPEGTRNTGDNLLLPFKSGLYYLARSRPGVECVPVWIENLNRVMPKGEFVPIPLLCTVTVGAPITVAGDEEKDVFLERCRQALLGLAAPHRGES